MAVTPVPERTAQIREAETMMQRAVLVDERDRRIGTTNVSSACFVISHGDSTFVRTDKGVRLRPADRALAIIFEETEIYVRNRLDPI